MGEMKRKEKKSKHIDNCFNSDNINSRNYISAQNDRGNKTK